MLMYIFIIFKYTIRSIVCERPVLNTQYLRHYLYTALLQVAKVSVGGHGPGARGREVGAGAVPQGLHQRVLLYYILYCIKFIFVKLRE